MNPAHMIGFTESMN